MFFNLIKNNFQKQFVAFCFATVSKFIYRRNLKLIKTFKTDCIKSYIRLLVNVHIKRSQEAVASRPNEDCEK